MGFLDEKNSLTREYNAADTLRAGTAPGLIDLVDKVTRGGHHVFFGEPHFDGMTIKQYETLANNYGVFRAAAHNGVKHLVLEYPSELQPLVDKFAEGKISKNELAEEMKENLYSPWIENDKDRQALTDGFVGTINNARSAGMKIHLADVTWRETFENLYSPEMQALEKKFKQIHEKEKLPMPFQEFVDGEMAKMPQADRDRLFRENAQHQENIRSSRLDDSEQYAYLRQRIPNGESIMGVVGLSHLDNNLDAKRQTKTMGIDDYLMAEGGKNVTTIEMHTSESKKITDAMYQQSGAMPSDRADYTVVLDQKTITDGQGFQIGHVDQSIPEQEGLWASNNGFRLKAPGI